MSSSFNRFRPASPTQGIGGAAYQHTFFADRSALSHNISSFGNRIGDLGAHTQTLDFMRNTGILQSGANLTSLTQIQPEHLRTDITEERLKHFRDFTSAVVSESDFVSGGGLENLALSDIGIRINEALMSKGVVNSLGEIDREQVQQTPVALSRQDLHADNLSDAELATVNSHVQSVLSNRIEAVSDPFVSSHGDSTLNLLWHNIKETTKWMGYGSLSAVAGAAKLDISYNTARYIAIAGALTVLASLSTAPPLLATGIGVFAAGKVLGWAANHMDKHNPLVPYMNMASRVLPLIGVLAGGVGLGIEMYQTNIAIMHLAKSLGLMFPGALAYGFGNLKLDVMDHAAKLKKSYGGQIDPGTENRMKSEMEWASYSIASEKLYLGVRIMLLAVSSAFMVGALGMLVPALISIPAAGFAATAAIRNPRISKAIGFDGFNAFKFMNSRILRNFAELTKWKKEELLKDYPSLGGNLDKIFMNPDADELIFKRDADKHIEEHFGNDELIKTTLLQMYRRSNQNIKDDWMIKTPLKGIKYGLWGATLAAGGVPALLAVSLLPHLVLKHRDGIIDKVFEKNADTGTKAIARTLAVIAPMMASALALTAAGVGLAPIAAYAAFVGSTACLLSELHGGGHSINTSEGFRTSLAASSKDLIGNLEINKRAKGVTTLIVNPHTGTHEHSLGIFFSAMFNTQNPNISFVCMSDKQPYNTTDLFDQELAIAHSEKVLLTFVKQKQNETHERLLEGVTSGPLIDRYTKLAANLRDVAEWFKGGLTKELQDKFNAEMKGKKRLLKNSIQEDMNKEGLNYADLFENPEEDVLVFRPDWESKVSVKIKNKFNMAIGLYDEFTEDAERVALQQLQLTANELEQRAERLDKKARKNKVSDSDFNTELDIVRCYDSELVEILTLTRKEIAGDERMVRKVENVATINLFRGLAVYKFWRTGPAENYPVADWVTGTWTRVRNPNFRYDAEKGTRDSAKHIWINRDHVLTEVQQRHKENLSTSDNILLVDNDPSKDGDRFIKGEAPLTIKINGQELTLSKDQYYYLNTQNNNLPEGQTTAPKAWEIRTRENPDDIVGKAHSFNVNIDGTIDISDLTPEQITNLEGLKMTGESTSACTGTPIGTISLNTLVADMEGRGLPKADIDKVVANLGAKDDENRIFDRERDNEGKVIEGTFRYKRVPQKFRDAIDKLGLSDDAKAYLQTVYEAMEISPSVLHFGAYDYSVMMDKNDIEVRTHTLLPAILEREKGNVIVDLIHKYSHGPGKYRLTADTAFEKGVQLKDVEVVDANIELAYTDSDGARRIIPYKIDRGAIATWRKDGFEKGRDPNKERMIGAELETDADGNAIRFSLLYNGGAKKVDLDLSAKPRYLTALFDSGELPKGGVTPLDLNAFFNEPFTEGDIPWIKVTTQSADNKEKTTFVRCHDRDRPMLYKKKGLHNPVKNGDSWNFGYFNVTLDGKDIHITDVRIPRGLPVQLIKGWTNGLKEGDKVEDVNNTGNIFITGDGKFTVEDPQNGGTNLKGHIIGMVEGGGEHFDGKVVDLGNMLGRSAGKASLCDDIIEISRNDEGEMEIISRRHDASGLALDSSGFIYTFTEEASKKLEAAIPDLNWIDQDNIQIKGDHVVLTATVPGTGEKMTITLNAEDLVDNFGSAFLQNKEMQVSELGHIYTGRDERFRPSLDIINGNLRLVVHKVDRKPADIALPANLAKGSDFVIRPTTANSAVKIGDRWVPLNMDKVLMDKDNIDLGISQVYEGEIKSVIGPQTRFGNWGDISLQYPRDPYFYGLPISAGFETIGEYGENFGLNRAKALRGQRGIESGRTHTMPYTLLHNSMFADIMETNSEYYKKLSDYGHWLTGAGVSEDTQMEMILWMMGLRMHVVKEMLTIMAAEKTFDKYKIQNTTRYNYSESLFTEPFKMIFKDLLSGLATADPYYFAGPEAMSEITAGRTWYKYPWAKSIELSAIPSFLLTKGYVPFFPVDMPIFMSAWLFRTFSSMRNYKQQLNSLGYGLLETGLFDNPAKEIGYLHGYNKGAWEQWLYRYQYATFALTSGGGGGMVPQEFKNTVNEFYGATVNAEMFALTSVLATNAAEGMANNPTAVAAMHNFFGTGLGTAINMLFGAYIIALLHKARSSLRVEGTPTEAQVTLKRAFKIKPEELSDSFNSRRLSLNLSESDKIPSAGVKNHSMNVPSWVKKTAKYATLNKVSIKKNSVSIDVPTTAAEARKKISDITGLHMPASAKQLNAESLAILKQLADAGILKDEDGKGTHFTLMADTTNGLERMVETALAEGYKHRAKDVAEFIGEHITQQEEIYDGLYDELQRIKTSVNDNSSYSTLFSERDALFNMLRKLGCVDKKGRISFGMQNKWRNQANEITEIMALIEMSICINAVNDIKDNKLPTQALAALRKVIATTQEHLVIDAASKMYRQVTAGKQKFSVGEKNIPRE